MIGPAHPGALTPAEYDELAACEQTIAAGLATFRDVGAALLAIRDRRLYRASHGTFESYCREKWHMDRRHANRTIEAATIAEHLGSIDPIPIANVAQARELAALPEEIRADVWREAVETAPDGRVTAAHIRATADRDNTAEAHEWFSAQIADSPRVQRSQIREAFSRRSVAIHELCQLDPAALVAATPIDEWSRFVALADRWRDWWQGMERAMTAGPRRMESE